MSKKILVMTGSPRRGGNSDRMAEALIRGAEQSGHTAVKFEAAFKTVGWCTACDQCWKNGHACVQNDDFRDLEPLLESCDTAVFAAPVYWMGLPASLKAVIDKLYAYGGAGGTRPLAVKEAILLLCGADTAPRQYEYVAEGHKTNISYLNWADSGVLWQGGAVAAGDIDPAALEKAEQMGRGL